MYICMYVCMHACMYVYMYMYRNAIIATYFLWARHRFHAHAVEPRACTTMKSSCRKAAVIGKPGTCTAIQRSGSKKKRGHRREVYRQQVRLIWWQESDDRHSQYLELAERSAEQHNATQFPRDPLPGTPCMH